MVGDYQLISPFSYRAGPGWIEPARNRNRHLRTCQLKGSSSSSRMYSPTPLTIVNKQSKSCALVSAILEINDMRRPAALSMALVGLTTANDIQKSSGPSWRAWQWSIMRTDVKRSDTTNSMMLILKKGRPGPAIPTILVTRLKAGAMSTWCFEASVRDISTGSYKNYRGRSSECDARAICGGLCCGEQMRGEVSFDMDW